jgi:predicted transcriptional regulator of viral defense system
LNTTKTLGTLTAKLLATLRERGQRTITTQEVINLLGTNRHATEQLLSDLVSRRWLKRIERGKYMILPLASGLEGTYTEHEFLIAASLIAPYYISYWTALSYYGFTEQVARTVFVAALKQKRPVEVSGITFRFVRLSKHKFFGFVQEWIEDKQVNIASREKTVVDCLDLPQYCGGVAEAIKGLWYGYEEKSLDWDTLTEYAERMGNRTIFKRLGYLAELLELPIGEHISLWNSKISSGYGLLDPAMGKTGSYNTRWNLLVNLSPGELLEWREH